MMAADPLPVLLYAVGFPRWKRQIVREFLQSSAVRFVRCPEDAPADATLVVWGQAYLDAPRPVIRMEDAFLRSVGLGADLIRPLSLVLDRRGMYYDATSSSDLEHLLETTDFSPYLLARASRLRKRVVEQGITKYNSGERTWLRPDRASRVILVPGQVESDASLRYGAPHIRTNMGLLQAVRARNPNAYIIYKPHPDVVAGLRENGEGEEEARCWSDEIVTDAAMGVLLSVVDEVHVLTSLAGFEALLREKPVWCYGQPFYAGWGLTQDLMPVPRRTRHVALDELVAAALILYPTYVSRRTARFTTPEGALDELIEWRREAQNASPWVRNLWRLLFRLWKQL